jgi:hypothetical protein
MSPSALVPNGVKAARPPCVNSDLATKPFRQLQRQRIKCTYLKLKAFATLALVLLILSAALPRPLRPPIPGPPPAPFTPPEICIRPPCCPAARCVVGEAHICAA